jgi:glucose/arabinose dehydrogenase
MGRREGGAADHRDVEPAGFGAEVGATPRWWAPVATDGAEALLTRFPSDAFVGQDGSWNRKPRSGYKVIFVPFEGGQSAGDPWTC